MRLSAQVAEQNDREFIVGPSRATRDIIDLVINEDKKVVAEINVPHSAQKPNARTFVGPDRVAVSGASGGGTALTRRVWRLRACRPGASDGRYGADPARLAAARH